MKTNQKTELIVRMTRTDHKRMLATRKILGEARTALDDWILTYAHEHCDLKKVEAAKKRLWDGGGTIAYVSNLIDRIDDVLSRRKKS